MSEIALIPLLCELGLNNSKGILFEPRIHALPTFFLYQDPSLLSLFSLMFLAGFPDVFRRGCLAQVKEGGDDVKKVVVEDYSPEQTCVSVINFKNRKKLSVKDHTMEPIVCWHESFDNNRLPLFIGIIQTAFLNSKGKNRQKSLWQKVSAWKLGHY